MKEINQEIGENPCRTCKNWEHIDHHYGICLIHKKPKAYSESCDQWQHYTQQRNPTKES